MDDPDNPAPLHSDPRFLVATTLATLLLAGSAFICRTGSRGIWSAYNANHQPQPLGSESAGSSKTIATPGSAISLRHGHDYDPEAKDAKASRSKERRRRGKVPLKDLLKNPKKSKLLQPGKPTRSVEPLEEGRLPKIDEVMHDHGQPTAGPSSHENENSPDHEFETPSSSNSHLPSSPLPNTHNPSSSASSSTSTYPSSASASESATSPNTSPMLSQSLIDRTQETAAASAPSTPAPFIPKSKPGQVGAADPWDWDGAGPSSPGASGADSRDPTATPQRHKSPNQNQNQRGTPRDAGTGTSTSREWGSNAMSLPKLEEGEEEDAQGQVSMGTLNAQGTSTAPVITTTTSPSNAASSNTTTTNPPRRAPTPRDRRPPTPLSSLSVSSGSRSGSPPPQTQLASMRGALEAARMREERLGKEVEALRWEGGRARRREGELQAQIHHLMNQLQVYAAMLSGQVSPHPLSHPHQHQHPHPHQHQHIPAPPSTNGTNGVPPSPSINVNGYATAFSPPSSNPHSPPPPPPHPHPHLHIPSVQAQMLLNTIVPSPTMGFHGHTHSPHASSFYGAAVAGGGGVYPGSPMQASPWSMFSPVAGVGGGPGGVGGGGPVVGTGEGSGSGGEETESVGSESPDLDGEGAGAGGAERERGRRRTRTAGGRLGGWELEEGDGWVGNEERSGLEMEGKERIEDREGEDEEGLNEVLADAILKRPGSIRGLSRLGKVKGGAEKEKEKERESPLEEFRFPSISDFGNVVRVPVSMSMSIPEVFQPLYETSTEMDVEQEQAQTEQERVEPEQEVVLEDEDVAKTQGVSVDVVVDLDIVEEEEGKEDLTPPAARTLVSPPPLPTIQPTMTKTAAAKQSEDSDAAVDSDKGQREVVQS